jgi:hypothetical protein
MEGTGEGSQAPDIRPLKPVATATAQPKSISRPRTSGPGPRHPARHEPPDNRPQPGHPASFIEHIRVQPGHPTQGPDIRLLVSSRTSGPQLGHPAPVCAQ